MGPIKLEPPEPDAAQSRTKLDTAVVAAAVSSLLKSHLRKYLMVFGSFGAGGGAGFLLGHGPQPRAPIADSECIQRHEFRVLFEQLDAIAKHLDVPAADLPKLPPPPLPEQEQE